MYNDQVRFYGTYKGYQTRWEKVQTERASLNADLLEAEAIWGNDLKDLFEEVFKLESELRSTIRIYMEMISPETEPGEKDAVIKNYRERRHIMYDTLNESDEYSNDLSSAIEKIEKYLKPKLSNH